MDYTPEQYEQTKQALLSAGRRMKEDGWWWDGSGPGEKALTVRVCIRVRVCVGAGVWVSVCVRRRVVGRLGPGAASLTEVRETRTHLFPKSE